VDLNAAIERLVDERVQQLALAACHCTCSRLGDTPPRTAYSIAEAAASLGLTYEQTRALCHSGEIRAVYVGRYIRVPADALREALANAKPVERAS
jgi:excisionase family DNA binding protein